MRTRIAWVGLLAFLSVAVPIKAGQKAHGFQPPRVISTAEAAYPVNTVQGGTVVLEVTVAATGAIEDVRVVQGAHGFTQQAIDTVKKWKFAAATFEGKPVTASIPVAFSFSQPIVWWTHQKK